MLHAGLAFEFSRILWDDRHGRGHSRTRTIWTQGPEVTRRQSLGGRPRRRGTDRPSDDPWWAWRVVEPDAEYLRRRAA